MREDKDKHEAERDEDSGTGLERTDEDPTSGSISWTVYQDYIRAGMSPYTAVVAAVFVVLVQGCFSHIYLDYYFYNSNAQVY